MKRHQIKRKRATLEDAHNFHKSGSYSVGPEHRTTDEERKKDIDGVSSYLEELVKTHFPRTTNLEYAILKGHLIIEYALTEYIRCHSRVFIEREKVKFSFSQKLEIAYLMGFGVNDPTLFPTVEAFNRVRNQVAHTFSLDSKVVDELIRINSEDYDTLEIKSDKQRISGLRKICLWVCGFTAGVIIGEYAVIRNKP